MNPLTQMPVRKHPTRETIKELAATLGLDGSTEMYLMGVVLRSENVGKVTEAHVSGRHGDLAASLEAEVKERDAELATLIGYLARRLRPSEDALAATLASMRTEPSPTPSPDDAAVLLDRHERICESMAYRAVGKEYVASRNAVLARMGRRAVVPDDLMGALSTIFSGYCRKEDGPQKFTMWISPDWHWIGRDPAECVKAWEVVHDAIYSPIRALAANRAAEAALTKKEPAHE